MKMNVESSTPELGKNILTILKGTVIAIVLTLIILLIFSAILTYTSLPESIIAPVIIIVTAISILIGSFLCTMNIKKNGIVHGAAIGILYIFIIYIISSIISGNFALGVQSMIMIIIAIIAGMLRRCNWSK